jgi:hypothetical protein
MARGGRAISLRGNLAARANNALALIDDDGGALHALVGRDPIDDAIGANLARVFIEHGHPGLDPGTHDHDIVIESTIDGVHHRVVEGGNDRREDTGAHVRPLDPCQLQQVEQQHLILIAGSALACLDSKIVYQAFVVVEAEDRVRIADVDDEEHLARPQGQSQVEEIPEGLGSRELGRIGRVNDWLPGGRNALWANRLRTPR